jgi:hypothetical protein
MNNSYILAVSFYPISSIFGYINNNNVTWTLSYSFGYLTYSCALNNNYVIIQTNVNFLYSKIVNNAIDAWYYSQNNPRIPTQIKYVTLMGTKVIGIYPTSFSGKNTVYLGTLSVYLGKFLKVIYYLQEFRQIG